MAELDSPFTNANDEFLVPTNRIDRARLVIISLCGGLGAVAKQASRDPKMIRVIERDRGRDAIPK